MVSRIRSLISDLTSATCCFCGESIRGETPQDIVLPYADGSSQHLLAHGRCLSEKLHPDIPYLTPAEMQDDD